MADFNAKKYANKADKAEGKIGHVQVSGTVEVFAKLLKGDAKTQKAFDDALAEGLK